MAPVSVRLLIKFLGLNFLDVFLLSNYVESCWFTSMSLLLSGLYFSALALCLWSLCFIKVVIMSSLFLYLYSPIFATFLLKSTSESSFMSTFSGISLLNESLFWFSELPSLVLDFGRIFFDYLSYSNLFRLFWSVKSLTFSRTLSLSFLIVRLLIGLALLFLLLTCFIVFPWIPIPVIFCYTGNDSAVSLFSSGVSFSWIDTLDWVLYADTKFIWDPFCSFVLLIVSLGS